MAQNRASGSGSGNVRSFEETMRAPSTTVPGVVMIDTVEVSEETIYSDDPKKDLWVSTVDGRYQSPVVPLHVGDRPTTFYVHRDILNKSLYFKRALEGAFSESLEQTITLPEEDATTFSFLVAYLYEQKFAPIKPLSSILGKCDPKMARRLLIFTAKEIDKGKGKAKDSATGDSSGEDLADSATSDSDIEAQIRHRRQHVYRLERNRWDERQRKQPGRHRPDCNCDACHVEQAGQPCWNCGVVRQTIPPPPPPPPIPGVVGHNHRPNDLVGGRLRDHGRRRPPGPPGPPILRVQNLGEPSGSPRKEQMSPEDIRVWLISYSLAIDAYICADRYLMDDFKECIASYLVDQFEIAGMDAAHPEILQGCRKLFDGVDNTDPLLRMLSARVGFLLSQLWKTHPEVTSDFFVLNAEVASYVMKETLERRTADFGHDLPAMRASRIRTSPVRAGMGWTGPPPPPLRYREL